MPIYEFECLDCGQNTEILMASSETDLVACGNCGGKKPQEVIVGPRRGQFDREFP